MTYHQLLLYALSTCIHCKHAKEFLNNHGIKYDITHVDLLNDDDRMSAMEEILKYNPNLSFPTLIIDNGKHVIVGFREDDYKWLC